MTTTMATTTDHQASQALFRRLQAQPGDAEIRAELMRLHAHLADGCARRYQGRGEPLEDLSQIAAIGLLKAIDRFDVERGSDFSAFALPTILGEVRRHFRDHGWAVQVPRRLQELRLRIRAAATLLSEAHGRPATSAELAEWLAVSQHDVEECLQSSQAYSTTELTDESAIADNQLEHVELREALRPLLDRLTDRERDLLGQRFFEGRTQSDMADTLGVSQQQVARRLERIIGTLRDGLAQ